MGMHKADFGDTVIIHPVESDDIRIRMEIDVSDGLIWLLPSQARAIANDLIQMADEIEKGKS